MTAIRTPLAPPAPGASDLVSRIRGDYVVLRFCLWSCLAYAGLGLLGFAGLAGFWPPPGADLTATQITAYFSDHETALRIGMVLMAVGGPFFYVWSAVVSKVVGRMEGPMGVLSTLELLGGLLTAIVTFVPAVVWLTASFRIESRSPETVQVLYDFGWLFFDLTFACSLLQQVALGVAILRDPRDEPLIPRWVAYVSFLSAATYLALTMVPFVRTGPLAWNGLLSFWAVFVSFFVVIAVVTPTTLRALRRLESDDVATAVAHTEEAPCASA